ncbi:endonuclease/exonuclease/phosphatase family metal-dependent hydrolase [Dyadobacter jejuensis]|uniref:Endonuclease/exonuclease/phosphatase family metal-dependent hydrolase n=1 Tax=Dyadobacter jejuensis TaxID=1082580 RepID=A0A316ATH5_9BACT|nr:endonuclease/exonuclease/phosphatase family protein [Dyadobacter jejuensis]PWJ60604.1 endonuclease/exonuclease/phosphatase family metal-dependent hydrolase [Dyadobacter jejuensis]
MSKITYGLLSLLFLAACAKTNLSKHSVETISTTTSAMVKPVGYTYPTDSTFKVLSWNVEHFVDGFDDPYINNERENNPPQNMALRTSLLVRALRQANADVVVLQEFESAKFLNQLAQDSLASMGYLYFADVTSHSWYMNVVVMSRFPMGVIEGYGAVTTALPGYFNEQGVKETQNQLNSRMWTIKVLPSENYSFLLTGVHLKAGRSARDIAMRKGQLALLTERFNEKLQQNPKANMVLAGDMNATPESEEIRLMTAGDGLVNRFVDTIDPSVLSHPADRPSRRLDYILMNQNMLSESLDGGAQVANFFSADTMRIVSDHLPVVARFVKTDR